MFDRGTQGHVAAGGLALSPDASCLTLIRRTGTIAIAAKRRSFAYHPATALALLLPKTRSA
jgi:hypothetical protein